MPPDASLIVLLVTILLPVDPLSLTVNAAKVLVVVFCSAEFLSCKYEDFG